MIFESNDYANIHAEMLAILKHIDKTLVDNNCFYSLACGSVLGAVREKGFISWDLDADVFIKVEDREKVRALLKENMPSGCFYEDASLDNIASHDDISFKYKGVVFSVDIYPLVGFPTDKKEQKRFIRRCKFINKLFSCKYSDVKRVRNKLKWAPFLLIKIIEKLIPDSVFRKKIKKMESNYSSSGLVSYIALDGKSTEIFRKEILFETTKMPFEDTFFLIPKNYEFYLRCVYGDNYMTPIKY